MKIDMGGHVLDVVFNPGRKTDGRPNAGLSYTASLRCSSEGVVRLTLATDFTPPCVLVELPVFDVAVAGPILAELGLYMPPVSSWVEPRPGVYAFIDGVRYVEPVPEELEFMAAFGFVPGARFDLALPMLRAQRAELFSRGREEGVALEHRHQLAERFEKIDSNTVQVSSGDMAVQMPAEAVEVAREVGGAGVPMEPQDAPAEPLPAAKPAKRQRRAAKPAAVEESTVPAAAADVFDVLDVAPTPSAPKAAPAAVEANPFMIEGL